MYLLKISVTDRINMQAEVKRERGPTRYILKIFQGLSTKGALLIIIPGGGLCSGLV